MENEGQIITNEADKTKGNNITIKEKTDFEHNKKDIDNSPKNQNKSVRRVGTLTMGICLIITGVLVIYALFNPNFDYITAAKLSPAILVLLGLEVMVSYFISKGERLKYDFLSGFVCFILIIGCLGLTIIPQAFAYFGPQRSELGNKIANQIYDLCYSQLKDDTEIADMDVNVSLQDYNYPTDISYQQIKSTDRVNLNISFIKDFESKSDFAESCKSILTKLSSLNINFDSINFYSNNPNKTFELTANDKFKQNMDVASIEKLVESQEETPAQ